VCGVCDYAHAGPWDQELWVQWPKKKYQSLLGYVRTSVHTMNELVLTGVQQVRDSGLEVAGTSIAS
jgi:hypothetical protein